MINLKVLCMLCAWCDGYMCMYVCMSMCLPVCKEGSKGRVER